MRLWAGVLLLRLAVMLLVAGRDRYYIIPSSRLPDWLGSYLEYLEGARNGRA